MWKSSFIQFQTYDKGDEYNNMVGPRHDKP